MNTAVTPIILPNLSDCTPQDLTPAWLNAILFGVMGVVILALLLIIFSEIYEWWRCR